MSRGLTYIFDEPSTGMHPRDVYRMNRLLLQLRDKGNTVLVVEHDEDVIAIADHVIDVGPLAGKDGGEIVFTGSFEELRRADTLTGKSTLISKVFAQQYEEQVLMIDQGPITATNRSTPASYMGFFDEIRKLLAKENGVDEGWFSFNSAGACPVCAGKGVIVTELAFMDPVISECEACGGYAAVGADDYR